ncbi:MAG TPA: large conductance mechanosensitive channel protein MscL [Synechococcales cyanobacterium M55_K2018_004]|nr:large conductance mechanosensitive channel protein MscL [Synechococcales cyanobacterium M55_K2018_004]
MTVRRGRRAAGGFLADFRDFVLRGNVIDLAVAVIIGAAFSDIVNSLVGDIITPLILQPALQAAGVDQIQNLTANGVKYGVFLAAVINFLVIAFVLFLLIRSFEAAKRQLAREDAAAEEVTVDPIVESNTRLMEAVDRLNDTLRARG